MFDRFTDRARKVTGLSRQESQRYNHDYIGTEHILLGLIQEGSGVGADVLRNLDVDPKEIRRRVDKLLTHGTTMVTMGQLPFTPAAIRVLECSLEESSNLGHNYIGTEHLVLGLIREEQGIGAQVLHGLGVTLDEARSELVELLGAGEAREPQAGPKIGVPRFERLQAESALNGSGVSIHRGAGLALLPRTDDYDVLFAETIRPAMGDVGLETVRAVDVFKPDANLSELWSHLRHAEVIVADASGRDPSVLYALGLCHGLHRCPIMLVRDPGDLPFSFRSLRYLEYGDPVGLRDKLQTALAEFLAVTRGGA